MANDSFIVGLLTCATSYSSAHTNRSVAEKLHAFKAACDKAKEVTNAHLADLDPTNEFSTILVAPEYFFTGKWPHRSPMLETTKVTLDQHLEQLSDACKKILLVPGSLYYFKTTTDKRRKKAVARINDRGMTDLKLFGGEEAFYYNFTKESVGSHYATGLKVPSLVDKMTAASEGPLRLGLLRNTAYLFLDGNRVAKYDKQSDYHESLNSPDDMVFVPGTDKECPRIGAHRFGIEICFDHALGRLNKRGIGDLDFHIVVSDYADNNQAHMAMGRFGYFLHASTNTSETKVYFRGRDLSLTDLTNDPTKKCAAPIPLHGGTLQFFLLKLPKVLKAEDQAIKQQKKSFRSATISPTGPRGF
jgi:predicted amidohydrolase